MMNLKDMKCLVRLKLCVCVCLCYGIRTRIACPNYELVKIIQPGFQPQTVATPYLDSGYPTLVI